MLTCLELLSKYSSRYHTKMQNLTRPLSTCFGIDYFHFHEVTYDGRMAFIANQCEYNEYFFSDKISKTNSYMTSPAFVKEGLSSFCSQKMPGVKESIALMKTFLNIVNAVSLTKKTRNGYCVAAFGYSENNPYLFNLCHKRPYLFEDFLNHFLHEGKNIIPDLNENCANLISYMGEYFHYGIPIVYDVQEDVLGSFYQQLGARRQEMLIPKFTSREKECIEYLLLGLTAKEISKSINLSPRTVENYIATIKDKMQCRKKSELIRALHFLKRKALI